ncbi:DUF2489 domain-containing protein [Phocoenobacter skyensis]|uniref:DUF2489 domain-containing protein n=1 Tax=Phocoenobacter skyensis TaxID=97481 RepID=A0A1H7WH19_9PAST|nr:DUF2489 domain-containing protein [Pasteurella skyensis]MDP8079212.1 DUF2489 domain-containing protein [Pasteurella skyensis]MDP8085178.1 DUF2489 domain-containing protein [Pasteurella skyensis]MDP8170011.1 DUF2489 domain-containing protein [Pasteurella skyensis]MDP8175118.1 DUF2489 domain-containing protein [Pasteurella skyensis]MDP8185095.1 DUF2489 domain-containing protein [Pasteurella skyensis]
MIRFFLGVLALLIILALGIYALSLLLKLHKQTKFIQNAKKERYLNITNSIDIIARSMLAEQCNLSEGVRRLKPLLDVLGHPKLATFPAMWALFKVVEDMPILEERNNMPRNQRIKLDLKREAAEIEHQENIKLELRQLLIEMEAF